METAKSQNLSLRSLDVGGRPIGTDRLSFVPPKGEEFHTRLAQDMAEVQADEANTRRVKGEQTSEHARERQADAARDQAAREDSAQAKRSDQEARLSERQADARADASEAEAKRAEGKQSEARREASQARHDAREGQQGEQVQAAERNVQEVAEEVPSAPTPQQVQAAPEGGAPQQTAVSTPIPGVIAQGQPGGNNAQPAAQAPSVQAVNAAAPTQTARPVMQPQAVQAGVDAPKAETKPASTPLAEKAPPSSADLERAEAVLKQIKVSLHPKLRSANIQLNPAELGRLSIRLQVKDEGVHAVVRAESAETLAALERHLPELRSMLASQGFEGAEFDLGMANGGREQGAPEQQQNQRRGDVPAGIELTPTALARPLAAADGGVDLIA